MNNDYYSPLSSLSSHRLAGVPLSYSPKSKTPVLLRLQAGCWNAFFAFWSRLRLRPSPGHRHHNWPNEALS